jgi:hypothetical protein
LVKEGDMSMVVPEIDAHKRTHTVVAVDEVGLPRPPRRR